MKHSAPQPRTISPSDMEIDEGWGERPVLSQMAVWGPAPTAAVFDGYLPRAAV